jgi:hypothetical protein
MEEANSRAAACLFGAASDDMLDLHYLYVKEALEVCTILTVMLSCIILMYLDVPKFFINYAFLSLENRWIWRGGGIPPGLRLDPPMLEKSFICNDLLDLVSFRICQGVYQPGKPGNRKFEKSGKNREIAGNFVNGQEIFVIYIFF